MIWGYHYFRKHPFQNYPLVYHYKGECTVIFVTLQKNEAFIFLTGILVGGGFQVISVLNIANSGTTSNSTTQGSTTYTPKTKMTMEKQQFEDVLSNRVK